jgi:hypothetical protein
VTEPVRYRLHPIALPTACQQDADIAGLSPFAKKPERLSELLNWILKRDPADNLGTMWCIMPLQERRDGMPVEQISASDVATQRIQQRAALNSDSGTACTRRPFSAGRNTGPWVISASHSWTASTGRRRQPRGITLRRERCDRRSVARIRVLVGSAQISYH